jgi:hypothetical protein
MEDSELCLGYAFFLRFVLPIGNKEDTMVLRTNGKLTVLVALIAALGACATETVQVKQGELLVRVEPGEEWLHRYSALKENPPQFAVWAERDDGSFAGTIFATRKVATGNWAFNGGNPRKEALPIWKHRKAESEADAVTGATPRESFAVALAPREGTERRFYLCAEFNHSTDWNDAYPKGADEGEAGYSGGSEGSGQPSILYRTLVDLDSSSNRFVFEAVGHGSPDGSDGELVADLSSLTSALRIVASVVAEKAR